MIYEFENQSTPLEQSADLGQLQRVLDRRHQQQAHQRPRAGRSVNLVSDAAQRGAGRRRAHPLRAAPAGSDLLSKLYTTEQSLDDERSARTEAVAYLAKYPGAGRASRGRVGGGGEHDQQPDRRAADGGAGRSSSAGGGSGHFIWPDTGPISQGFGCTPYPFEPYDPSCPQKHFHNGLDIAGACGNHIIAADAGIAYIEPFMGNGFGNYIIIVHGNGWQTLYGHLASFAIRSGQTVARGQLIGYEGTTGNSTGCHLHFGVNHNGQWVNPRAYLR